MIRRRVLGKGSKLVDMIANPRQVRELKYILHTPRSHLRRSVMFADGVR